MKKNYVASNLPTTPRGGGSTTKLSTTSNHNATTIMKGKVNVRANYKAGGSAGRGKGEYALVLVLLVYCMTGTIPIVQSMSPQAGVSLADLQETLKLQFAPVITEISTIKIAFKDEITNLKVDSERKYSELADRITNLEQGAKKMPYNKVASMPARDGPGQDVVEPRSKEALNQEMEEAQNGRRMRYRHQDHEARMRATPEQRKVFEDNYGYAYRSLGFYPCGDDEDMDQAKVELQAEGFVNPSEKAMERRCIKNFLCLDMGMTDAIYDDMAGDIERHWFEGKTAFCRCMTSLPLSS